MPLISDEERVTDRRSSGRLTWVLVAGGFTILWILLATVMSFFTNATPTPSPAAPATAAAAAGYLQAAQQAARIGDWGTAATYIQLVRAGSPRTGAMPGVAPGAPGPPAGSDTAGLSTMDKHTYFRV